MTAPPISPSRLTGSRLGRSGLLTREELQALDDASLRTRTVGINTDLIREGERADSLFIIVEGWACRYLTTKEGGRQLPALLVPGDIGNLDSLMFDRVGYGVRTLTQAKIVTLPCKQALALAARYPDIARAFTWLAMVENVTLSQLVLSIGRRSARERLAHLLCELSVRLTGESKASSSFAFPLSQSVVADALGLTSVHVNRMMRQLRLAGMIAMSDGVMTLPDFTGLRHTAGFDREYLHVDTPVMTQAS